MPPLLVGGACEVGTGFEPAYTALQAAASPLGHPTRVERSCERMTGFEPATSTLARWRSSQLSYIRVSVPHSVALSGSCTAFSNEKEL